MASRFFLMLALCHLITAGYLDKEKEECRRYIYECKQTPMVQGCLVDNGCDTADEIYKNPGVCGCSVDGGSGASLLGVALMVGAALQRRRTK